MTNIKTVIVVQVLWACCICKFKVDRRVPLIALISQPATAYKRMFNDSRHNMSTITESYVEWVEQTGAVAVLIPYDMPFKEMVKKLQFTHGLVLQGGGAGLIKMSTNMPLNYQRRLKAIIQWVMRRNKRGKYYPIWGTCLGFQEIFLAVMNNKGRYMDHYMHDQNQTHNINLTPNYWKSELFGHLSVDRKTQVEQYKTPIFYYHHNHGVEQKHFFSKKIYTKFNLLGTSTTLRGENFVAIMEAKEYPFFLAQFHSEKNQFEKRRYYWKLDRSEKTIRQLSSYIFRFVELIRQKSKQRLPRNLLRVNYRIKAYLSYYQTPKNSPVKSFERMYTFTTDHDRAIHSNPRNFVNIQNIEDF